MSEAIIRERHFCSKILWFYNKESVKSTNIYSEICDTMIKMKSQNNHSDQVCFNDIRLTYTLKERL